MGVGKAQIWAKRDLCLYRSPVRRSLLLLSFILSLSGIGCSNERHFYAYPEGVEASFQRTCSGLELPGHGACACVYEELRARFHFSNFKRVEPLFGRPGNEVPDAWLSQALNCGLVGRD